MAVTKVLMFFLVIVLIVNTLGYARNCNKLQSAKSKCICNHKSYVLCSVRKKDRLLREH